MEKYFNNVRFENIKFDVDKFGIDTIYDDLNIQDHLLRIYNDDGKIPCAIIQEAEDQSYELIAGGRLISSNMNIYKLKEQKCLIVRKDVSYLKTFQIALREYLRTIKKSDKKLILDTEIRLFCLYYLERMRAENSEKNCDELLNLGIEYLKIPSIILKTAFLNRIYEGDWSDMSGVPLTKILLDFLHHLNVKHTIFIQHFNKYYKNHNFRLKYHLEE